MPKIFIDANIFLFGYRINKSNSYILLENIDGDSIQPVVSRGIIEEVRNRAKKLEGKDNDAVIGSRIENAAIANQKIGAIR